MPQVAKKKMKKYRILKKLPKKHHLVDGFTTKQTLYYINIGRNYSLKSVISTITRIFVDLLRPNRPYNKKTNDNQAKTCRLRRIDI